MSGTMMNERCVWWLSVIISTLTTWSDSTGPGLLTAQDADPSEDVAVIVEENAVDGRPADWLFLTFLDVPAAVLL